MCTFVWAAAPHKFFGGTPNISPILSFLKDLCLVYIELLQTLCTFLHSSLGTEFLCLEFRQSSVSFQSRSWSSFRNNCLKRLLGWFVSLKKAHFRRFPFPREAIGKQQEPIDVYPTTPNTDMSVSVNEVRNNGGPVGGSPHWWLTFVCVHCICLCVCACVGERDCCTMSFLWWLHWQHMGSLKGEKKREGENSMLSFYRLDRRGRGGVTTLSPWLFFFLGQAF